MKRNRIELDGQLNADFQDVMFNIQSIMNVHKVSKKDAVRFLIEHYRFNRQIKVKKKPRRQNEFQFSI